MVGCGKGFITTGAGPKPAGGGGGGRPGIPGGPGGGPAGPGGPMLGGPGGAGGGGTEELPGGGGGAGGPGGGAGDGELNTAEQFKADASFGPSPEFRISSFASSGRFAEKEKRLRYLIN